MFTKNNIWFSLAMLLMATLLPIIGMAQDVRLSEAWQTDDRHGISVDFRVNSTVIDPNYRNNATAL